MLALVTVPRFALAKGGQSPEDAAAQRDQIEAGLAQDPRAAVASLRSAGEELGDPELFLLAAERARDEAQSSRDAALALEAESLALVAQDIGSYLADDTNYSATDWRPVTRDRASELAGEAGSLATQAHTLAEEIEAERAAAAAAAERARLEALTEDKPKRELKPGTGLIAGGSAALVLGAGGIGLLGAGIAMGQANQREAESLNLPDELARLEELDRKGATANTLAYVGGVVAGVGVAVGVALIVVGVKKRKAAGPQEQASVHMSGWFDNDGGGLALRGSF
ncbi:hypothetical protein ENSA7_34220 [Enhygromyxa salina]|uniref:Uncharacterized protein n=1 Tax=Enhygromyxa salina TaxID=215803 RepID=A0A2S9YP71_9BACT|nr:hypothetical protein ENSA7_34220 [Enhygromyxa salina]